MTYSAKDNSATSGEPVEFYHFSGPFGEFFYTTSHDAETFLGNVYQPLTGLDRTAIEVGTVLDTIITNDITIPCDCQLAQLYAYGLTPKTLRVKVYRAHRGDDWTTQYNVEWDGEGIGYGADGETATIATGSRIQSLLNGGGSSVFFQRVCNHVLYDERCKADINAFTVTATVTKVRSQQITVDNDGYANGDLSLGLMKNIRTGEEHSIVDNTDNLVKLDSRFIDIVVGDTVKLTLGCNHLRNGHCLLRFNNVANYGGYDFIPIKNPFDSLTNQDKITKSIDTIYETVGYSVWKAPWAAQSNNGSYTLDDIRIGDE